MKRSNLCHRTLALGAELLRPDEGSQNQAHSGRLASLDGWRAFSILLVLGSHCKFTAGFPSGLTRWANWLFDGDLGVRFFFAISGFLITWLLILEENQCGRISLKHFYIRRALRILPVYFAFLLILVALQWLTPFSQTTLTWVGNLTLTRNFIGTSWTSGHLWSLSVEEQFYLLWPGLFLISGIGSNLPKAVFVLALPMVIAPIWRIITYLKLYPSMLGPAFGDWSFFKYFDCLAIGCLCAFLLARKPHFLLQHLAHSWKPAVVAGVLILTPYVLSRKLTFELLTVPLGYSLQGCGFGILMLQSTLFPTRRGYQALNWSWVSRLGGLSYSIYIWQQLFSTKPSNFGLPNVWWLSFPGWLLPVLVVSFVSYYAFERPCMNLRRFFRLTPANG